MIFIGADHQGRTILEELQAFLKELSLEAEVVGEEFYSPEDDYPDFAKEVVLKMFEAGIGEARGIMLCGSGQGMAIAANRFRGIRAGLCWNVEEASLSRSDDDINVLCLPVSLFKAEEYEEGWKQIVKVFLETEFKNAPKYSRRKEKLDRLP